ncbi:hypothetical protein EPO44_10220 [bacterium]|nr:MAG: hypothetical protein EPO44_10220 [bacterium]
MPDDPLYQGGREGSTYFLLTTVRSQMSDLTQAQGRNTEELRAIRELVHAVQLEIRDMGIARLHQDVERLGAKAEELERSRALVVDLQGLDVKVEGLESWRSRMMGSWVVLNILWTVAVAAVNFWIRRL